ncbi:hypothetical protein PISMIDRAFT_678239, partial [Pisolithus microcarpus 441]
MSKYRGVGRADIFNGLHFCSWHFVARRGRAERQVIAVSTLTQLNPRSPNTALEDKPMDTNGRTVICLVLFMTASAVRRRVLPVL